MLLRRSTRSSTDKVPCNYWEKLFNSRTGGEKRRCVWPSGGGWKPCRIPLWKMDSGILFNGCALGKSRRDGQEKNAGMCQDFGGCRVSIPCVVWPLVLLPLHTLKVQLRFGINTYTLGRQLALCLCKIAMLKLNQPSTGQWCIALMVILTGLTEHQNGWERWSERPWV